MNTGNFAGYIGRDAELKAGPSGDPVANFSIAVNTGTKEKPSTLWVDCALWGKRADALAQYLTKGQFVAVTGDINCRAWIGKDGHAGCAITLRVDKLTFGGQSKNAEGNGNGPRPAPDQGFDPPAPAARPAPAPAPANGNSAPRNTTAAFHEKMAEMDDKPSGSEFSDDIPFACPVALDGLPF